jgi:hypothetical protein
MSFWKAMIAIGAIIIVLGLLLATGVIPIGSGNLQTQQKNFSDFTIINLNNGLQVQITQGSSYNVSITADSNVINRVDVTQTGNVLTIGLQPGTLFDIGGTLRATIMMPDLQEIDLTGGSSANVANFAMSHDISVSASGGSTITMNGQANGLSASCSGGGGLKLSNFHVNTASVQLSGGSSATISVSDKLDANLSGGSSLTYSGNPTLGTIINTGLSTITRRP